MKRSKNPAKKQRLEEPTDVAEATVEKVEKVGKAKASKAKAKKPVAKEAKEAAKEAAPDAGKEAAKESKKGATKKATEEREPQPSSSRSSRKKEKGKRSSPSPSPSPAKAKKGAKHLATPRTHSPEVYESSENESSSDDEGEGEETGTFVVYQEKQSPEVGKSQPGSGGKKSKTKYRKLTEEEQDELVEYYRSNPIFYDKSHDDFLNRDLKRQMRIEKAATMKISGTYFDPHNYCNTQEILKRLTLVFAKFLCGFSCEI